VPSLGGQAKRVTAVHEQQQVLTPASLAMARTWALPPISTARMALGRGLADGFTPYADQRNPDHAGCVPELMSP
jgi:hypothetical protein